ncbi:MAG TPA: gephyrin-like molybdotransferase Glp [Acidimicrobiales bacterium]|nr:gephyrin-like molybdotransferase Glp [Acidimicrobiales bacterium]
MISVNEARRVVLGSCRRMAAQTFPLAKALGLVLAQPVRAREPVPPFANSSMDGYALRAANTAGAEARPSRLRVVGMLLAGDDPGGLTVGDGEAVRIMTGAALPPGADAVCMVEQTRSEDGWVLIETSLSPGAHVRLVGEDVAAGEEALPADTRLGPAHIGVLASLGVTAVLAYPRPRVGVISTGDELAEGDSPLKLGKIRDSNRPALLAQLTVDGWGAVDLGKAGDDPQGLTILLQSAVANCDAVVTSGGVSVGDRDIVRVVLEELGGGQARWLQVAVKPAKPFAFSTLPPNGTPVFGLPGNPVSALVSYELFVRPALRLMAGFSELDRPRVPAVAEADLNRTRDGKLHLARVAVRTGPGGGLLVRPSGGQGSHQLRAMAGADALAILPDGEGVKAGEAVEIVLLDADALAPAGEGRW